DIEIDNVAPTLNFSGATSVYVNQPYQMFLWRSADPGQDTLNSWFINWGDGNTSTLPGTATSATNTYAHYGNYTINAAASDEDGSYDASQTIKVAVQTL